MSKRPLLLLLAAAFVATAGACTADNVHSPGPEIDVEYVPLHAGAAQAALDDELVERLQARHYNPVTLDDGFSRELLKAYLNDLDGAHSVFLASDIAYFRGRYGTRLDDALRQADLSAAFDVYNIYQQRRIQIAQWLLEQISAGIDELDLNDDEHLLLDRSDVAWPEDLAARRDLWGRILENQIITMRLNDVDDATIVKRLTRRYESRLKQLRSSEPIDVLAAYMGAYTSLYDPHTAYFTPRRTEDFEIGMNLSLQGIGAQLRSRNGYPEIVRLISGGPAADSGELEPTDRILAVGQGQQGEFVELGGLRLGEAVQLIRGRKGSTVRLRIMAKDGSHTKVVSLVRDKIELKERDASKHILEIKRHGQTFQVGVIELPSFYNGTTEDVRALLAELEQAGVAGVIVDLRNNGGGSLREVTRLIGLFMPTAPSVQIRMANGDVHVRGDASEGAFYSGPLAVMVNRLSASASEIFAGAIQDYGRGVIVGSRTFGKGTVQVLLPLESSGRIKLTQAKFYRVTGASTQKRGVTPDIRFPTAVDPDEIGESSLPHALPWDKIPAVQHPYSGVIAGFLAELRARHEQRVEDAADFQYRVKRIELVQERGDKESLSLNIDERRQAREQRHQQMLALANAHRRNIGKTPFPDYQALKDHDDAESSNGLAGGADPADEKAGAYQVETANILLDLVALAQVSSMPSI